jgi:hypothetical protein
MHFQQQLIQLKDEVTGELNCELEELSKQVERSPELMKEYEQTANEELSTFPQVAS